MATLNARRASVPTLVLIDPCASDKDERENSKAAFRLLLKQTCVKSLMINVQPDKRIFFFPLWPPQASVQTIFGLTSGININLLKVSEESQLNIYFH